MRRAGEDRAQDVSRRRLAGAGVLIALLAGCGGGGSTEPAPTAAGSTRPPGGAGGLAISSRAFGDGEPIPERYTCDGDDLSPPLSWSGAPGGTAQLALVVDDPDAPGGTFTHWVVWGIDPADGDLGAGEVPAGAVQGTSDFGETAYGGPCPPSGTHHYRFELLALSAGPSVEAGVGAEELRGAVEGKIVGGAVLTGTYGR
ncbi:MAG: YbhB/YbcL family Raf kinase inhibitor-like protein [Acidimicrobiia bacterium]|nr:YbhB/YbcL family Raf kinase inhibitor-like protein [Acidimicrobiia bacterium]